MADHSRFEPNLHSNSIIISSISTAEYESENGKPINKIKCYSGSLTESKYYRLLKY